MTPDQRRAVLERLQRALLEVALCEAWLAHNMPAFTDHQKEADSANARALQISRYVEETRR